MTFRVGDPVLGARVPRRPIARGDLVTWIGEDGERWYGVVVAVGEFPGGLFAVHDVKATSTDGPNWKHRSPGTALVADEDAELA